MDLSNVKAAVINLDVDNNLLTSELLSIPDTKWDAGFDHNTGCTWKSIFIRINNVKKFNDFKNAKSLNHTDWYWDPSLNIPYIKSLVESLPMHSIGMIRGFILEGPFPMHIDSNETTPSDLSFKHGLTIASRLDDPMILDGIEVPEKNIFFNDTILHGFPNATGTQISIRIFGDFDYQKFNITKVYK